jgi:hypothetical protein
MNSLAITTPAAQTAGVGFPISVSAKAGAAVATGFNGQATVTANYFGLGAVPLGTITFSQGTYYGYVTLYAASAGNVTLTITTSNPALNVTSGGFKVNTGALASLLMVAPGETFVSGTNGGTGKTGTPVTQTAGVAFNVNVYAVDAYWNTIAASTTISLSSSDPNSPVFNPPSKATGATGVSAFIVTLKTVGSGAFQSLTATASGAATSADVIPMTFNTTVDHFMITSTIPTVTAGQLFQFNAVAMDAYNNTVTTFSGTPTLQAYVSTTALGVNNWQGGNTSFSNGFGTFNARIYQRIANNANVKLTSGAASGTTNNFSVNAGQYSQMVMVPPGQTFNQGVQQPNEILSGSPNPATVGVPYTINLFSTDDFGNQVVNTDSVSITVSDIQALVNGSTPPQTVTLSGGQASFGVTFRTGGNMSVYANDITDIVDGIPQASANISVLASTLASFQLTAVTNFTNTTAGSPFTLKIIAKDQYNNIKTNYTGTVIVSSTTDWSLPYESTMQVTGTNTSQDTYKWAVVFQAGDNGEKDVTAELFMAAPNVQIFASDVFNDTPTSYTGHVGFSADITVTASTPTKLQILPPGVVSRPGTADGINNTPTGESQFTGSNQAVADFTCTVNLTDNWWNPVTSGNDTNDQVNITSNDPANTNINDVSVAGGPQSVFLYKGTQTFKANYAIQTNSFQVIVQDSTQPSILSSTSTYIPIYTVIKLTITAPGGGNLSDIPAGTAFTISMTAYSSVGVVATGFNGTVHLSAPSDYNSSEYTISPTTSIPFTGGVAVMQVTIYRAYANDAVQAQFASTVFPSNSFNVNPGPVTGILVIPDGMTGLAGLKNVGIPGYIGYGSTAPNTVEAGSGHELTILYVDDNYNQVTIAAGTCDITSTDPAATVDGNSLVYSAPIAFGQFQSLSGFILRTVGATGQQTVTATDHTNGNLKDTSPDILVRHTTYNNFTVSAPSTPVTAGVPFNIIITAYDIYGNICDDTDGGVPFNSIVNLTDDSTSGANTMLPSTYKLTLGQATASVQLFQAHSSNTHITSKFNGATGTSNSITIIPNDFKRLFVQAPGMSLVPGSFTNPQTMQFPMYDTTKPPFWTTSNSTPVNDALHTSGGYPFTIYAMDAYGNIVTGSADVLGQTVTVFTNDQYAVPVTPVAIDETSGQAGVYIQFHTAMTGVSVTADYTNPQIQNFTTPTFTTIAGTPYGLQVLVPGLSVNNGAGSWNGTVWDNAIVGTASAELSTQPFPVTIQVADIYGNFTLGNNDHVSLSGPAVNTYVLATSFPTSGNFYTGQIGDSSPGMTTLTAHIDVSQNDDISLSVNDNDSPALNVHCLNNPTSVNIITGGNLGFLVYARNLSTDPWSNTVNVITTAAPNTFGFQVIIDSGATSIPVYGVNRLFNCTPVSVDTFNVLGGTLGIQGNSVLNGTYATSQQSYTDATSFRIKVTDPLGVLLAAYSPIIVMGANPNSVSFTVSAQSQNVRANTATNIYGKVIDSNGNPVIGVGVTFTVQSGNGVFDPNSNTKLAFAVTNSTGNAIVQFYGSYQNEIDTVKGTYNSVTSSVKIEVSVVAPILGVVSNYPNPFKAGAENTNISYLMDTNQDVTINIYNLFGDLVFTKSINAGTPGATAGMNTFVWNGKNSKGVVVGNGGYICVVQTVIQSTKKNMVRKIAVAK